MVCNKCGENNLDDAKFCRSCGANLGQPNVQKVKENKVTKINFDFKKILGNKKIIIGAVGTVLAVVVLVIAISVISSLTKTELYTTAENYISYAYSPDTEKTSVFFNDTLLASPINGRAIKVSSSTDGKIAAFISEDNVLYIVEKDSIQKIADDIIDAVLCYNGNVMAYLNQDNVLYTIQLSNRKIEKIADDVVEFDNRWFSLSPDGNTLLYLIQEEDKFVSHIKTGSNRIKLENFWGFYTSDNGQTIYGIDNRDKNNSDTDDILGSYDLKTGSFTKLNNSIPYEAYLNSNHTQLLYSSDSKYYLSINGSDRIKVGNYSSLFPIMPKFSFGYGSTANMSFILGCDSFIGTLWLYETDNTCGIGYIDENFEMHEVIKKCDGNYDNIHLTDNGDTIYYTRDQKLYKATRELNFEPEKLISDVECYQVTSDGKMIYYINSNGELICYYKNEDKIIAEDVYIYSLTITENDTVFFMTDYSDWEGTLYRCNDGKNKVRVADDVYDIIVYPKHIVYYTDLVKKEDFHPHKSSSYTLDMCFSTNAKDFKKVADDVNE